MQERIIVPYGDGIWLHPGHFMLAATLAIMVQPGFKGCLTLELVNDGDSPIMLYPGARIAQLAVHTLDGPTEHVYGPREKYDTPIAPQASRLAKERDEAGHFGELRDALHRRMLDRPPQSAASQSTR